MLASRMVQQRLLELTLVRRRECSGRMRLFHQLPVIWIELIRAVVRHEDFSRLPTIGICWLHRALGVICHSVALGVVKVHLAEQFASLEVNELGHVLVKDEILVELPTFRATPDQEKEAEVGRNERNLDQKLQDEVYGRQSLGLRALVIHHNGFLEDVDKQIAELHNENGSNN